MKRPSSTLLSRFAILATLAVGCRSSAPAIQHPAPPTSSAVTPEISATQQFNDSVVQSYLARLGARQNDSAGTVFRNLQLPLKNVPARQFLSIMNGGYARALGVTCEHCHVLTDFASDEKQAKLAAREMAAMHRMINQELAKMQHIRTPATQNRAINCMICHRGKVNPR